MLQKKLVIFSIFSIFLITSCSKPQEVVDCSTVVSTQNTYTNAIKSIIDGSCATSGCHTQNSRAGGIALNTYATVKTSFINGKSLCSVKHT
ncbi:MAG TPA: hypothetical protein PKD85_11690, partial [Saprospiraceae bacterium]|nr:hypothetical protein [Saprospiraceae bacterium]